MDTKFPTLRISEINKTVEALDQRLLPYEVAYFPITDLESGSVAIRDMVVRGAPLIGVTAAYTMWAISLATADYTAMMQSVEALSKTRPTAVNLFFALDRIKKILSENREMPSAWSSLLFACAQTLHAEDEATNLAIGKLGAEIISQIHQKNPDRPVQILTHCNAGRLATTKWGTATAPVYVAHQQGIPVHVWVDETRPRNQGFLTAWELAEAGVPYTVIVDNAGGQLMQDGLVDLCLVGTDRTTRGGDVANKIGTYLKALAADANGIPFYVALPSSTIDWELVHGADILIEQRPANEVRVIAGTRNGVVAHIEIASGKVPVQNPAFDVTPAKYITGLITERGISEASEVGLFEIFPEYR